MAEVLVAVFILGIACISLYAGFATGFMLVDSTRQELRATQILTQKAEALRLCSWGSLTNFPLSFSESYDPTGTNGSQSSGSLNRITARVDGSAAGGSALHQQGQALPPSSGAVTAGGDKKHGYDRYVISGTLGGCWQWQRQAHEMARNQGIGPTGLHGTGVGANGSHFVGSLSRFTSRVHTWWKSRNPLWKGHRDHGMRAAQSGNHSANQGGRRGK